MEKIVIGGIPNLNFMDYFSCYDRVPIAKNEEDKYTLFTVTEVWKNKIVLKSEV